MLKINLKKKIKNNNIYILEGTRVKKERKWRRSPEVPNSGKITRLN
jgi:hypothetical protein